MQIERITTNRQKPKEDHDDGPDAIAVGAYDLATELHGREHAWETQLRWERMDANNKQEETRNVCSPANHA